MYDSVYLITDVDHMDAFSAYLVLKLLEVLRFEDGGSIGKLQL